MIFARVVAVILGVCAWAGAAAAEYVGTARLLSEDYIGDGHDRWRTGSYQIGLLFRPSTTDRSLDMVELRFATQAVAPWNLRRPDRDDRRFAGVIDVGVFGYAAYAGVEIDAGFGLGLVGPQTHVDDVFKAVHLGENDLSALTRDNQIGDAIHLVADLGIAKRFALAPGVVVRPYGKLVLGVEDLAIAGADVLVGRAGTSSMRVRDQVTGQLLPQTDADRAGWAWTLGADAIHVENTALLPDQGARAAKDLRWRARSGLLRRGKAGQIFYGLTWLSEEFETQPESQMIGSLHVHWIF